jgi:bifunctional enzyme CysN/CysC
VSHQSDLIATDIGRYLKEHEQKDLLRFLTCGSVDDGKSTLIGRLLHDSKMIYEDQLASLEADSVTQGTVGDEVDLALLMDGLKAEREQGITIDVAYRYFSTAKRKFIIADTPGHEQYTRNMATGASTCDLAVILVDARYGVLPQTKRHSFIAALLGIRHVVVAINKMDLVGWSQPRFDEIVAECSEVVARVGIADPYYLPMSALKGDNVVERSDNLGWFAGMPLMEHLESVDVAADVDLDALRLPVQLVARPDLSFRGYQGTIASGLMRPGDPVVVLPSGTPSTVDRIVTFDGDLDLAGPGQSVTVTLADEVDVSRGDLICDPAHLPSRAHDVDAHLVWMATDELVPGKQYLLLGGNRFSNVTVSAVQHRIDMNTLDEVPAGTLHLNDIARVTLSADRELLFDAYSQNRTTGAAIVVDRLTNVTVASAMLLALDDSWDRSPDTHLERRRSQIAIDERVARYGQQPATVLLTGLSGAGKSTIATALERRLFDRGRATIRLDGQNMRLGISRDLGFTATERSENLRRAAEVARLVNNQGLIAVAAFVAPHESARERARELILPERFIEVFVDTPIEACRARVPEMYAAADRGEIENFPGVTATYEPPQSPDLVVDGSTEVSAIVERIIDEMVDRGILTSRPST